MNRRRTLLLVIVGLGLAGGLAFLFWPKQSDQPQVHLKIVNRAVEQGRQVVFFRVEGAGSRRIQIVWVGRIIGDWRTRCSLETDVTGVPPKPATNFWAPSQVSPIMNLRSGRKEFGIMAPTNASVWQVRVIVNVDLPTWERVRAMPRTWSYMSRRGMPFLSAASGAWNAFYDGGTQDLYSDSITNSVPPESSSIALH